MKKFAVSGFAPGKNEIFTFLLLVKASTEDRAKRKACRIATENLTKKPFFRVVNAMVV